MTFAYRRFRYLKLFITGILVMAWCLWDVMELLTWKRTEGEIVGYQAASNKHGAYYRAKVTFTISRTTNDTDDAEEENEYEFLSRYQFHSPDGNPTSVIVAYKRTDPNNAELLMQLRYLAGALGGLAAFAMGIAGLLYWCDVQCLLVAASEDTSNESKQQSTMIVDDAMYHKQQQQGSSTAVLNGEVAMHSTDYAALEDATEARNEKIGGGEIV